MGVYRVENYLERAKSFIAIGDENSLRHACLELRFCIESIVYQKLNQIGERLPLSVYRTWQPSKAMKLLLSFEPRADQDASIRIYPNTVDGKPSGEHIYLGDYKMFSVKWLNKHYNKLGKFLHMTSLLEADAPPQLTASMIEAIVGEIERVAAADVIVTLNSITVVQCVRCNADMYASSSQIKDEAVIECYQDQCSARHRIKRHEEGLFSILREGYFSAACKGCGQLLLMDSIEHGEVKTCDACGFEHLFQWSYNAKPAPTIEVND